MSGRPASAQQLPFQTPNSSAPIGMSVEAEVEGLLDSLGKPITGMLQAITVNVTSSWRYLFGTFVQRTNSVNPAYTATAGVAYSQAQIQALIDQVAALSKAVGKPT